MARLLRALAPLFLLPASVAAQEAPLALPLSVAVAEVDGKPVVDEAWIKVQVDEANRIYRPHGVTFTVVDRRTVPQKHAYIDKREDRDALGTLQKPSVVNCYFVARLMDIHTPGKERRGVHWRPAGQPKGTHLVIVSAKSFKSVLAHELGHFFGNREHPETIDNVMSYNRGKGPAFLNDDQAKTVRRFARWFIRRGELVPQKK